jgi:hypothetical protein
VRHRSTTGLLAGLLLVVAACSSHPVGPARTFDDYERKASTTAAASLSAVETVRLAATAGADGKGFGPFLGQVVSDQEEDLSGVQGTFASIQPPGGARADALRSELDDMISDSVDHVSDVRIAIRRGELGSLADVAKALDGDAERLRSFVEAHG